MKKTSKTTKTSGKPSVVFFGSGPVAAQSLALLIDYCEVEAVVTKPSTVKEMTQVQTGLCVHSVNNRTELDEFMAAQPFFSEVGVLIDFGIIISKQVIDYFPMGVVNSHFSLLPEWRGADPISFSILSGQPTTGVSLMLLDEGMDTGQLLAQESVAIDKKETTPTLTTKLITLSDKLLRAHLPKYVQGQTLPYPQPRPDQASYSRKLTKEDGVLDFTKPAIQLEREIRAFIDWPKSRTTIAGKDVVITGAEVHDSSLSPGTVKAIDGRLLIGCSQGSLEITHLKPAGKKEMPVKAFLAGYGRLLKAEA